MHHNNSYCDELLYRHVDVEFKKKKRSIISRQDIIAIYMRTFSMKILNHYHAKRILHVQRNIFHCLRILVNSSINHVHKNRSLAIS
jgi:hypothetical protein